LKRVDKSLSRRKKIANGHPHSHSQEDPEGEVTIEEGEFFQSREVLIVEKGLKKIIGYWGRI